MCDITFETYMHKSFVLAGTERGDEALRSFQASNRMLTSFPNDDLEKVQEYFESMGCSVSR